MKKLLMIACLSAFVLSLAGCAEQTDLSTDTLPTKVTVTGYVRYIALDKNLSPEEPEVVSKGHPVNIFYGVPGEGGKVEAYALKTVNVDAAGFFEVELGCPVGKALEVRVQSSMVGDSYTLDEEGKKSECETYFYGEATEVIPCGSAHCFALDMAPAANTGEDGLVQP